MNTNAPVITLSYTTPSGQYLKTVLGGVLNRYKYSVAIPLSLITAVFLATSVFISDMRFAFIALMMLLIIIPGLMALGYFSVSLTPEATETVLPRHLIIHPHKGITVIYEPFSDTDTIIRPAKNIHADEIISVIRHSDTTEISTRDITLRIPDKVLPVSPDTIFTYTERAQSFA